MSIVFLEDKNKAFCLICPMKKNLFKRLLKFGKKELCLPALHSIKYVFMEAANDLKIKMFSDPLVFLPAILADIKNAGHYIYFEVYRFRNDPIGIRVRDALIAKCRDGVKIKLLVDSWGAASNQAFFKELIDLGGEVKFFKKIRLSWDAFTKNHRRDHRKILVIDDEITWIGSANVAGYALNWRESMFRIKGSIAIRFKRVFLANLKIYNKYFYDKLAYTRKIDYGNFQIIRDVPSITFQPVQRKLLELIRNAKNEIWIETPYFLPGYNLRRALADASQRGVRVNIIMPQKSDIHILDVLAGKYMGELARAKVGINFYVPQNLHSKLFMVDRKYFLIGSANFDYRSFRYQHEICLFGEHKSLIRQLTQHFQQSLKDTITFNYESWKRRPRFQKFIESLLVPFRHLL
jgi:cardiolipin synthase A/B